MSTHAAVQSNRPSDDTRTIAGNRLVLAGVIVYLCEWVAIIGAGGVDSMFAPGTSPEKVLAAYAGHSNAIAWASGWFSVVLLGRVLFAVALRHGLRTSGRDDPVAEFGVLAMLAGVISEVTAYGVVTAAALLADHGGSADTVAGFDTAALSIEGLLWGATGVAVVALSWSMFRSAFFSRILCALGMVGGTALLIAGLVFNAPEYSGIQGALGGGVPVIWVWMVWTGVVMWRRTPIQRA
jgi:hypothetical protein